MSASVLNEDYYAKIENLIFEFVLKIDNHKLGALFDECVSTKYDDRVMIRDICNSIDSTCLKESSHWMMTAVKEMVLEEAGSRFFILLEKMK